MQYQSDQALEELRAFVAVVDAQGFRAAARSMHGRTATLSQRVQDLEGRLGVSLLVRTTRSMRLTDEGRAYFEHATRALSSAREAEAVVLSAKADPRGLLRISTSPSLAAHIVDAVVTRYLVKYPHVRAHLHAVERRLDIVREGFDVAIWGGPLEDSSLLARRLGMVKAGYFASPRYLAKRAAPTSLEDLASHDLVSITKGTGATEWRFVKGGKPICIPIKPRLVVSEVELAVRAAVAGLGITPAPLVIAERYLAKKQLVQILPAFAPAGIEIHAVFPAGGALVPKTRAFLDMLAASFAPAPAWKRGHAG